MLKLIIFDMDGVIIDSEYMGFGLLQRFVNELKTFDEPISLQQFSSVVGRSYQDLFLAIKQLSKSPLSVEEIGERLLNYDKDYWENLDYLAIFRQDIHHIIHFAKANNIKLAVASSADRKHIERILTLTQIREHFDFIMSGKELVKSKPDPTIYQKVLAHFNLNADQVIAIEDSEHGIASAKGAGLKVIAYEETRILIDQSKADFKGKDMNAILTILQSLHFAN
ncbi:HAD family hydrolase [Ursidibacter arcticus]